MLTRALEGFSRMRKSLKNVTATLVLGVAVASMSHVVQAASADNYVRPYLNKAWKHFAQSLAGGGSYMSYDSYACPASDGSGAQLSVGAHSEGQGYILGMALFNEDQASFVKIADWTIANMKRPNDALLGWTWVGGKQCVDNAVDGDMDFAYYLLKGAQKWGIARYKTVATQMIQDLWEVDVQKVGDKYYIDGGSTFASADHVQLDPSYYAKWMFVEFATADKTAGHDWQALADNTFPTLDACTSQHKLGLPPDWCYVDKRTGKISLHTDGSSGYGNDAYRVFWKTALTAKLGDPEAKAYLSKYKTLFNAFFSSGGTETPMSCSMSSTSAAECGQQTLFLSYVSAVASQRLILDPNYQGVDEKTWFLNNFVNRTFVFSGVTTKTWADTVNSNGEAGGYFRDPGPGSWGDPENRYFGMVLWLGLTNLDKESSMAFDTQLNASSGPTTPPVTTPPVTTPPVVTPPPTGGTSTGGGQLPLAMMTLPAPSFRTKSGASESDGHWTIYTTAGISDVFRLTKSGSYTIWIESAGTAANGVYPNMAVLVDGVQIGLKTVQGTTYRTRGFRFAATPGNHRIEIRFVNDASGSQGDRNLYLGKVKIVPPK
jgi:endo-1,4-beta-D-glucanase Y